MMPIGSYVRHLVTEILPWLRFGVYVQIYDAFCRFEYPEELITEGRPWNNIYALRAFPLCLENEGGRIWLSHVG